MTKKEIIQLSLLAILVIGVIVIAVSLFKGKPIVPNNEGEIKAKDETIAAVIRERDTYRAWKDEAIQQRNTADSLLQVKYKTNTIKYERIPVIINALPPDELVRAAEEFR